MVLKCNKSFGVLYLPTIRTVTPHYFTQVFLHLAPGFGGDSP